MEIYDILLSVIQHVLAEKHITEKDCCANSGVNRSFFSDWKSGRSKRQAFDSIYRICKFLNISIDNIETDQPLLTGNQEDQTKEDPDLQRVIGKYINLDDDGKDAVKWILLSEERRMRAEDEAKNQRLSG